GGAGHHGRSYAHRACRRISRCLCEDDEGLALQVPRSRVSTARAGGGQGFVLTRVVVCRIHAPRAPWATGCFHRGRCGNRLAATRRRSERALKPPVKVVKGLLPTVAHVYAGPRREW